VEKDPCRGAVYLFYVIPPLFLYFCRSAIPTSCYILNVFLLLVYLGLWYRILVMLHTFSYRTRLGLMSSFFVHPPYLGTAEQPCINTTTCLHFFTGWRLLHYANRYWYFYQFFKRRQLWRDKL